MKFKIGVFLGIIAIHFQCYSMHKYLDFYKLRNEKIPSLVKKGRYCLQKIFKNDLESSPNPNQRPRIVYEVELDRIISLIHFRIAEAAQNRNIKKLLLFSMAEGCLARSAYQLTKNKTGFEEQADFYLEIEDNARRRICCINHNQMNDELLDSIYEMHTELWKRDVIYDKEYSIR